VTQSQNTQDATRDSLTPPASVPPVAGHASLQAGTLAAPRLTWDGPTWGLAGLGFLNFFLSVITLGIYGFWGRTEVRKRIWSSIHLNGEPLAYTGTGKELFLGFLIVFGAILVPLLVVTLAGIVILGQGSAGYAIMQVVIGLSFIFLGGVASYRARRYRLSRTAWRGIRGSLEGNSNAYGWRTFWMTMLVPLLFMGLAGVLYLVNFGLALPPTGLTPPQTRALLEANGIWIGLLYFGFIMASLLIVPWRTTALTRHMTNDMAFGSAPFSFTGSSGPLYARFIARWVGVVVLFIATPAAIYGWLGQARIAQLAVGSQTGSPVPMTQTEILGVVGLLFLASLLYSILTAWYKARELNYFASVTHYGGQPFQLGVTARGLIWLVVSNAPMILFTIGILRPVAQARTAKYVVQNMSLAGPVDFHAIAQSTAARSKTGEGLAQAFDVDAF
jgi:uncharacterized membrane protein YjgN (DUF898 family)